MQYKAGEFTRSVASWELQGTVNNTHENILDAEKKLQDALTSLAILILGTIDLRIIIRDASFSDHEVILLAIGGVCAKNELLDGVIASGFLSFILCSDKLDTMRARSAQEV